MAVCELRREIRFPAIRSEPAHQRSGGARKVVQDGVPVSDQQINADGRAGRHAAQEFQQLLARERHVGPVGVELVHQNDGHMVGSTGRFLTVREDASSVCAV